MTWTGAAPGGTVRLGTVVTTPGVAHGSAGAQHGAGGHGGAGTQGRAACWRWKQWKQPVEQAATLKIDTTRSLCMARISVNAGTDDHGEGCGSCNSTPLLSESKPLAGEFFMRVEKRHRARRKSGTVPLGCAGRLSGIACPADIALT
jgi:hypothetical protein